MKKDMLYYENSNGERVYFTRPPYRMLSGTDLFDYKWSYGQANVGIKNVYKEASEKTITIVVTGKNYNNYRYNCDKLFSIFEKDSISGRSGNIVYNGYRLPCIFVSKKNPEKFITNYPSKIEFILVPTSNGTWIKDIKKDFQFNGTSKSEFLDYPHGYPYDYLSHTGYSDIIEIDTFLKVYPVIKISGKASNPFVRIADKTYGVNTNLAESDTLILDSYNKKFYIKALSGNTINVFDKRISNEMLDGMILTAGTYQVYWGGEFNFSVDLICERSEPSWS